MPSYRIMPQTSGQSYKSLTLGSSYNALDLFGYGTETAGVRIVGLKKAMDRIAAYNMSRAKPTLEAAALAGANVAKEWVEEKMAEPKGGESYAWLPTRPSSAKEGGPTGQGEVPAIQFRQLVESLNTRNEDSGSPTVGRAVFGAGASSEMGFRYALALEFGGPQLGARPYMRPAIVVKKDEIGKAMVEVCDAEWQQLSGKVG